MGAGVWAGVRPAVRDAIAQTRGFPGVAVLLIIKVL